MNYSLRILITLLLLFACSYLFAAMKGDVNFDQARLGNAGMVATCFYGQGITLEGFDSAHRRLGSGGLVVQIQDLIDESGDDITAEFVGCIARHNNILHDSYNNGVLKVNNGAGNITVAGNRFYNQEGRDEH